MKLLSVVVPCYNEEETVADFYTEILKNELFFKEKDLDFEIIYIDDGSKDKTVEQIKRLHKADGRVHMVSFSRNFGKEAAMYAGFKHAKGDYVVTMDADLQDPPSLLPEMFSYIEKGYDSVATRRVSRKGDVCSSDLQFPFFFCQAILSTDAQDIQNGNCGRSQGLPPDDKTGSECHFIHKRI